MKPPPLEFPSVADQIEAHLHQFIRIRGVFAMKDGDGYLVHTSDQRERRDSAILVSVPDLKRRLLDVIPPLGGATYYYLHDAVVAGRFERSSRGPYVAALVEVDCIEVNISGEAFEVRFPPRPR